MAYQPNYGYGYPPQQQGAPAGYPHQPPAGYGGYQQPQYAPQPQYQQHSQFAPQPQYQHSQPQYATPPQHQAAPNLKAWFDAVDQDRSGRIDAEELRSALSSGGFQFSFSTTEKLIRMFDRAGDGKISFNEFGALHQFVTTMTDAFRKRDTSGDGTLDGAEIRAALNSSGYNLSEPTFQLMMRKFDRHNIGGLRLDDYIELSILIGTARNVFAFYDKQHTGLITFNFEAFFTAALSMR